MIALSNVVVIMPTNSLSSKGEIKRCIDRQCLSLHAALLHVCLPGALGTLRSHDHESLALFFAQHGVDMEEWMVDEADVDALVASSEGIVAQHTPRPQPPQQQRQQQRRAAATAGRQGGAAGKGGEPEGQAGSEGDGCSERGGAAGTGGGWAAFKNMSRNLYTNGVGWAHEQVREGLGLGFRV